MTIIPLPYSATKDNAPKMAAAVAELLQDAERPSFPGPQPAGGRGCSMCNTQPGVQGLLNAIVLDTTTDVGVMIGQEICTREHLGKALRELLTKQQARIQRLQNAITALGC